MKKLVKAAGFILLLATASIVGFAQGTAGVERSSKVVNQTQRGSTIAQVISGNPKLTMLAKALQEADLMPTLESPGPFTLFAPTDSAFNKVFNNPADFDNLLREENKERLLSLLRYHIVPGKVTTAQLQRTKMLKTVQTEEVSISQSGNQMMVNGGTVNPSPITASNGVIYVIDKVLMPEADMGNKENSGNLKNDNHK